MKKRLNLLCACVLIGLLLSPSTVISLMVQAVSAGFKAGYESVEKGKQPIPNGEWNHYLNFGPSKYLLPDTIFLFDPKYQPW